MKKLLNTFCLPIIFQAVTSCCNAEDAAKKTGLVNLPFTVDGQKRTAALFVPKNYDNTRKWPLII